MGRQGESRAVMRIAFNRLVKQVECVKDALLVVCAPVRKSTQIEVISGQIIGGPIRRPPDLRGS